MLHDPELLILDEPTDGLDPVGRSQVRRCCSMKAQGKTVFLNSHLLQEVELSATGWQSSTKGLSKPKAASIRLRRSKPKAWNSISW